MTKEKRIKISEKEAQKRAKEICGDCKHPFGCHVFWNHNKSILELMNCNECFCEEFKKENGK